MAKKSQTANPQIVRPTNFKYGQIWKIWSQNGQCGNWRCSDSDFLEAGSNPVLQIVNTNPIRIWYQLDSSNLTLVWVRVNISQANNEQRFFSKNKILFLSGSGYGKENLTPDPVGSNRSLGPESPKSSPCTLEMIG